MSEPIVEAQEVDPTPHLPTPPCSEFGADTKENQNNIKIEENEDTLTTAISKPTNPKDTNIKLEPTSQGPKKRGRPKSTEQPSSTSPSSKKQKSTPPPTKEKKPKQPGATVGQKPKRGRQPGPSNPDNSFGKEQDAYIRELFTAPEKYSLKDIHAKFEERFGTGKSVNVVRFRWYKIKEDAIVLSSEEEAALKKAIETVETNKALAILNEYGKNSEFPKLSQGFVMKKMKEWAAGGSKANKVTQKQEEEEDDADDAEEAEDVEEEG
ncbi:hypothetical protein TWF718_002153 [Orbilia javanica]|uniref:Uncharacterized protein n=1 Tax=Orbilia javanica TaxID=47235 RepID=A0AAN8RB74_9PEZI